MIYIIQIYKHDLQPFCFMLVCKTYEIQAGLDRLEQISCSLGPLHKEVELLVPFRISSTGLWDLDKAERMLSFCAFIDETTEHQTGWVSWSSWPIRTWHI